MLKDLTTGTKEDVGYKGITYYPHPEAPWEVTWHLTPQQAKQFDKEIDCLNEVNEPVFFNKQQTQGGNFIYTFDDVAYDYVEPIITDVFNNY